MFNLQGSEIIVILLLALVVLGPEKLPDAVRRFTQTYAELKKMGTGFQSELKSALDEPMREMRETANVVRDAADPAKVTAEAEAEQRLREDAANAQVHHLAPFTASADLPGATKPDPEPDAEAESGGLTDGEPAGDDEHGDDVDPGSDTVALPGEPPPDHPMVTGSPSASDDDEGTGEARTA